MSSFRGKAQILVTKQLKIDGHNNNNSSTKKKLSEEQSFRALASFESRDGSRLTSLMPSGVGFSRLDIAV